MVDFQKKDRYTLDDLLTIMAILRSPGGCPWDREQTHRSVRANFIEETYEAVEAIDTDNAQLLEEELGDVLLQVVLHARMEEEAGRFSFADVVNGVARKLVLRHPHVFGDVTVSDTGQVLDNWDAIKKQSKNQQTTAEVLKSVSPALPALMRSDKLQKKAEKALGAPAGQAGAAADSALQKAEAAAADGTPEEKKQTAGDLLFACVGLLRRMGQEPEEALYQANERFIRRFEEAENAASLRGAAERELSSQEKDRIWQPEE